VTEPVEIGNAFNNYFSKLGPKMVAQIEDTGQAFKFSSTFLIAPKSKSLFLKPITVMHNPAKSNEPQGIPMKYIKLCAQTIAPT